MKKLICLFLVLVLIVACFTCLVACGDDKPSIDDDFEGSIASNNRIAQTNLDFGRDFFYNHQ